MSDQHDEVDPAFKHETIGGSGSGGGGDTETEKKKCRTPADFMRTLVDAFTMKFTILLGINYFFVKGMTYGATEQGVLPIMKFIGVDAVEYQKLYSVCMIGWSMKPLIGTLSDARPILGLHKKYYMLISCIAGALGFGLVLLVPREKEMAPLIAGLFFFGMLAMATLDLLCEGAYTKVMQAHPESGTAVVTWVWWTYSIGNLIAACIEGPLADSSDPFLILIIPIPTFLSMFVPTMLGWLPESKFLGISNPVVTEGNENDAIVAFQASQQSQNGVGGSGGSSPTPGGNASVPSSSSSTPTTGCLACACPASTIWSPQQRKVVMCGIVNGLCALGLAIVQLLATNDYVIYAYLGVIFVVMTAAGLTLLPRAAFKVMMFLFIKEIFFTHIRGILGYWYTGDEQCVPGGPHFSFTYYQTFGNIMASVAQLAGVFIFESILSKGKYRTVFFITNTLRIISAVCDLTLVERWNLQVGISDHVMWLFGDQMIYQVCYIMDFMPAVMIMSRVCPPGVEATMFALLAGMSNFGQNVSYTIGALISTALGISTVGATAKAGSGSDSTSLSVSDAASYASSMMSNMTSGNNNGMLSGSWNGSSSSTMTAQPFTPTCNFENLSWLIIICHMLAPLVTYFLIVIFLPNLSIVKSTEQGEDDGEGTGEGEHGMGKREDTFLEPDPDNKSDARRSHARRSLYTGDTTQNHLAEALLETGGTSAAIHNAGGGAGVEYLYDDE